MTAWQQAGLQVNAWDSAPVELLAPLRGAGYTRIELLLNALRQDPPLGPPPRSYVDSLKKAGFNVYGVVWADSYGKPEDCVQFCAVERGRLNLNGFIINAEDGVEAADQSYGWSDYFLRVFRSRYPRLPLAINTYIGCGGINLPAWEKAQARMIVQTHHEGNVFEWGVPGYVAWAQKYGWKNKAAIKPQFSVYKGNLGLRADITAQVTSAKVAGTIGFSAYYAEGDFDEPSQMMGLLAQAKLAGACK